MKLLIGLGNPGREYSKTRHNLGFMIVDEFARRIKADVGKKKFSSIFEKVNFEGTEICIVKPQTFMNLSGEAVRDFAGYFKIPNEEILVVHDELDIELGRMKLIFGAGPGGHNGVTSLIEQLGTKDFYRLRVGIGKPAVGDTVDYVLQKFAKEEEVGLKEVIKNAVDAIESFYKEGPEKTMQQYNRK